MKIAIHFAGAAIAGIIGMLLIIETAGCISPPPQPAAPQQPAPTTQYGPRTGPPPEAPTLDYEELAGLDPQTQQTNRERKRNNDLEFRVTKLEDEVRSLNQIVRGIREVRIGESGPAESPSDVSDE